MEFVIAWLVFLIVTAVDLYIAHFMIFKAKNNKGGRFSNACPKAFEHWTWYTPVSFVYLVCKYRKFCRSSK